MQRDLDARRAAPSGQAGWHNAGVVEHQDVRRTQQVWQITDVRITNPTIDHQQPGRIPGGGGPRGDRFAWQLEVKILGLQPRRVCNLCRHRVQPSSHSLRM